MIPLISIVELLVWGAIATLFWILSLTVLLPLVFLLMYSKKFSDRWFSFIFGFIFKICFEPLVVPLRRKAFELLKEEIPARDASKPLKVLEIGVGPGSNFEFYPENCHLTALDRHLAFEPYLRESLKKYPNVKYIRTVTSMAEDMKGVEDCSMDVVISTYTLCSVTSVDDVLREVKRVLKPGGKYPFMEHVNHPHSDWAFTLQRYAEPLWSTYCGGCHLTRNCDGAIKKTGFSHVNCVKLYPWILPVIARPHIYGVATK